MSSIPEKLVIATSSDQPASVPRLVSTMSPKHDTKGERKYNSLTEQYVHVTVVVASYWFVSILTVFVNKSLLSSHQDFDATLFVTWFQCAFTVLFLVSFKVLARVTSMSWVAQFAGIRINVKDLIKVLPLSVVFVAMISFNNLCLKFVGVAFYYLARCLTTVTNVIFTFTILREVVSRRAIICCAIIVFGYVIGIDQEGVTGLISWKGVFYGVLSSCCVSLNSIYTKKILPIVEHNVLTLNLYNNMNAAVLFIPIMFLNGELPAQLFVGQMLDLHFWYLMVIGGLCGVAIGFVTALQIQVTSPLTHNISGTAKACVQTLLAVHAYNDSKSLLWWLSNFIVLGGSGLYAKVQQIDMQRDFKKPRIEKEEDDREALIEGEFEKI